MYEMMQSQASGTSCGRAPDAQTVLGTLNELAQKDACAARFLIRPPKLIHVLRFLFEYSGERRASPAFAEP